MKLMKSVVFLLLGLLGAAAQPKKQLKPGKRLPEFDGVPPLTVAPVRRDHVIHSGAVCDPMMDDFRRGSYNKRNGFFNNVKKNWESVLCPFRIPKKPSQGPNLWVGITLRNNNNRVRSSRFYCRLFTLDEKGFVYNTQYIYTNINSGATNTKTFWFRKIAQGRGQVYIYCRIPNLVSIVHFEHFY